MPDASTVDSSDAGSRSGDHSFLDRVRRLPVAIEESARVRVIVAGTAFLATTIMFLWPALFGLGTFAAVDMNELGDPYRSAIDREPEVANILQTDQVEILPYIVAFTDGLRHFDYRLWEPNVAAGVPLALLPTFLMVSPFNIVFLIAPAWYAIGLKVALQLLAGQVLMYLFLRRLRVGALPAVLGALLYVYCGTNIVLIHRMTATFLVPGVLWAAHRVVETKRWRDIAAMAGLVAWGWLEGFPSGWIYLVYLAAGWVAWLVLAALIEDLRGSAAGAWWAALTRAAAGVAGIIAGTGLVAFTMVPFIVELLDRGTFAGRVVAASVAPLRPAQLLGIVSAPALGEWRGTAYDWWTGTNPIESVALIGALAALVSLVGLVAAVSGKLRVSADASRAWAYLVIVAGAATTATYFGTPLLTVINRLPGLAGNPVNRTRFVVALAASVVVAVTTDGLTSQRSLPEARSRGVSAPRAVSAIALLVAAAMLLAAVRDWVPLARSAGQARHLASLIVVTMIVAAMVVLVFLWAVRRPALTVIAWVAFAGLVFTELAIPYFGFTPTAPRGDFYTATAGHETLDQLAGSDYRFAASGLTTFYPNGAQLVGPPDVRGAAMHSREFKNLIETISDVAFQRDAFKVILARDEWDLSAPALDHLAVRYFALDKREQPYGIPQDFNLTTLPGVQAGAGPYSIGTGESGDGPFVVESDETRPLTVVRYPGSDSLETVLEHGFAGARVAVGNIDGVEGSEIVLAPTLADEELLVFEPSGNLQGVVGLDYRTPAGGWWPSVGDVDDDGVNEIILGAGAGGTPTVLVLDASGGVETDFLAYDPGFKGGVVTAVGDVDGDGRNEIIVGPGAGGGPHVRVFDGAGSLEFEFFAFDSTYTGGVAVAAADVATGGADEIVAASLDGSQPVGVFSMSSPVGSITPGISSYYRVAAGDIGAGQGAELLVAGDDPFPSSLTVGTPYSDLGVSGWALSDTSLRRRLDARNAFAAVAVAVDLDEECTDGRLVVSASATSGEIRRVSERKIADLADGWNAFALDGGWVADGSSIDLTVESRSECDVRIGTVDVAGNPAVRWFAPDPTVQLVSTTDAWIYERPTAWPMVSMHSRWKGFSSQRDALEALHTGDVVPYVGTPVARSAEGTVPEIVGSHVTRQGAVVTTEGTATGLLVWSQNDALGWVAYLDGARVEHVAVDGALLGVFVPAGRHVVEFAYEPIHFRVGLIVSAISLGVLLALVTVERRRMRKHSID